MQSSSGSGAKIFFITLFVCRSMDGHVTVILFFDPKNSLNDLVYDLLANNGRQPIFSSKLHLAAILVFLDKIF